MSIFKCAGFSQITLSAGTYDILVQGAFGGDSWNGHVGGSGAFEAATFKFTVQTTLNIGVGGVGLAGSYVGGGGGGASWVAVCGAAKPLLEAGGGGGAGGLVNGVNANPTPMGQSQGLGGTGTNSGVGGNWCGSYPGKGGNGGRIFDAGGGGAGWSSITGKGGNGTQGSGKGGYSPNSACSNAGTGGAGQSGQGNNGGFGGGGGGGNCAGGGGGGYNGGGGGGNGGNCYSYGNGGGGGGSYLMSGYCAYNAFYGVSSLNPLGFSFGFVAITCYLSGTRILTTRGEVAVQELKSGDRLPTLSGQTVPIKWIGKQKFNRKFASKDRSPVRFQAGSLGRGLPKRDLYVSAGHSMKIGEFLVDARLLVNGVTITQHQTPEPLEYYHLDLGEHHCIIAEGAWAETYLECNKNRDTFYNASDFYERHPYHLTEAIPQKCLPHIADYTHPEYLALFKTLLAHIPQDLVTTDPDLHLLADDIRIDPDELIPQAYKFNIPAGTKVLRLKSRTSSPCELGLPSDDRRLGFCLQSLAAEAADGTVRIAVEPYSTKLHEGFHQAEGTARRWTQGDALLPAMLMGNGTQDIILTVKGRALARYHLGGVEVRGEQATPTLRIKAY